MTRRRTTTDPNAVPQTPPPANDPAQTPPPADTPPRRRRRADAAQQTPPPADTQPRRPAAAQPAPARFNLRIRERWNNRPDWVGRALVVLVLILLAIFVLVNVVVPLGTAAIDSMNEAANNNSVSQQLADAQATNDARYAALEATNAALLRAGQATPEPDASAENGNETAELPVVTFMQVMSLQTGISYENGCRIDAQGYPFGYRQEIAFENQIAGTLTCEQTGWKYDPIIVGTATVEPMTIGQQLTAQATAVSTQVAQNSTAVASPTPVVAATAVTGETESGATFSVVGAPTSVDQGELSSEYVNLIGHNTARWAAEPGGLTADTEADCKGNPVCWAISPDTQQKLVGLGGMGLDIREDAWLIASLSRGTFEFAGYSIMVNAAPLHNWFVVFRGLNPGDGDLNTPLTITDYDTGFGLVTNIPVSARISEDYLLQNIAHSFNGDTCGGGCTGGTSVIFFDANNGAWTAIHLSHQQLNSWEELRDANWQFLGSNIVD